MIQGREIVLDDSKTCTFASHYDGDIRNALANMIQLDGSIPAHQKHDAPQLCFSQRREPESSGCRRLRQLSGTQFSLYLLFFINAFIVSGRYFLYMILDKVVCPVWSSI
jgi:hypothetical protein